MFSAGQKIGHYVIVRHIADGGTSEVYAVTDGAQTFALKIIKELHRENAALQARFLNEAVSLESLNIEGVVRVFGNGDFQSRPYFVMEYLPTSLADRLTGPVPPSSIIPIIETLARVLATLHQRGFVHRDIKPHNVLFTEDGQLRLVDFSHAKHPQDDDAVIPHSTETGTFLGTRDYAAPEQFYNAKGVDGRADVYALGLVLFEALSGRRPFADLAAADLARQRLTRRAPRLSSFVARLPAELVNLTACMLDGEPRKRPTAHELAERLAELPMQSRHNHWREALRLIPLMLFALSLQPWRRPSLDDFDSALDHWPLQKAMIVLKDAEVPHPSRELYARQVQKRADLALAQGQLSVAAQLYEEAHGLFKALDDRRRQSSCANMWGDVLLHQGDAARALSRYQESLQHHQVLSVKHKNRGDEFPLTSYRIGLLQIEQGNWASAREQLVLAKDADPQPLLLSRITERIAALPGEHNAAAEARESLRQAEQAVRADRTNKKALFVRLRAQLRLAALSNDSEQQKEALARAYALWQREPEQGQWAHDLLEMLLECIHRLPRQADLIGRATEVLREMERLSQWRGDVHIKRWQAEIVALTLPPNGVLGE